MSLLTFQLVVLLVLLGLAALFSATEVAYTGLDRQQLKRIERLHPGRLALWEKHPNQILATLLLSNNAVGAAVGVLAANIARNVSDHLHVGASFLTMVFGLTAGALLLVFGEIFPKIWAQQFTVSWAVGITPFMKTWSRVVAPLAQAASNFTHVLLLGKARQRGGSPFLQKSELRRILIHSHLPSASRKLLDNVMDFGRSVVADVITDRAHMFSIPLHMPMEKVVENVIESGWSRVPVYDGSLDRIVGLLYSKDLLVAWRSQALVVLEDLLRPILTVRSTMPLPDLFRLFKNKHQHMAVVQDQEGGRVLGLVTLQDALEAIVGPIKEEI